MKLFLLQTTAATLVSAGAYAKEQQLPALRGSDTDAMVALQGTCQDGWDAGRDDVRDLWEDGGADCDDVWSLEGDADRIKRRSYPEDPGNWRDRSFNECARDAVDAEVERIERDCLENDSEQCTDLGRAAAEIVVKDNWCTPDYASDQARGNDYKRECKEAAYSICEGQIPRVADRWCPDQPLRNRDLRSMQRECEGQVDRMVGGDGSDPTGLPTYNPTTRPTNRTPTRRPTQRPTRRPTPNPTRRPTNRGTCGLGGSCGDCKQKDCPDPSERKECKARNCSFEELAVFFPRDVVIEE